MAEADYRILTDATGQRIAAAIEALDDGGSIKVSSFTGITSASGNVGNQRGNKYIVLSAFSSTGGIIVNPYAGSGADEHGQYTWWFNCSQDNVSRTAYVNQSVTIYYVYIEV